MRIAHAMAALALCGMLAGCITLNERTMQYSRSTTIGQELLDLQAAKEKGAVSEEEYSTLKQKLISDSTRVACPMGGCPKGMCPKGGAACKGGPGGACPVQGKAPAAAPASE